MDRPKSLTGEGAELWKKLAKRCQASGYLTPATEPSFELLCSLYHQLKTIDLTDTKKAGLYAKYATLYISLAKSFGMIPPRDGKYKECSGELDQFGIPQ